MLPALEEWRKDASAVRYHCCFSNCQHDDTWSIYNRIALLLLCRCYFSALQLAGKLFRWIVWVWYMLCPAALLICTLLAQNEREESSHEWCILITPTTQIELIETIANKSTCVRVSFAKRLHESKHEHCSHIKNITVCFADGAGVGGGGSGDVVLEIWPYCHSIYMHKCSYAPA